MRLWLTILGLTCLLAPAAGQGKITTEKVTDQIYVLKGRGGNIGLLIGPDGVFMIDDKFAPLTPAINAEIAKLTDKPVRFVINTHWHGDHTGGNENYGKAGAVIVAHENVRRRMEKGQLIAFFKRQVKPAPKKALPVITFRTDMTFHYNGERIEVFHLQAAHTDGDGMIRFTKANVLHTGDVFFNGLYPFIDGSSGGGIDGVIAATGRVLERIDDKTRIIPGHGPVTDKAGLVAYRKMLVTVRDRIRKGVDAGRTLEQIVASRPTREFDAKWGGGFLKPDVWVKLVHGTMVKRK